MLDTEKLSTILVGPLMQLYFGACGGNIFLWISSLDFLLGCLIESTGGNPFGVTETLYILHDSLVTDSSLSSIHRGVLWALFFTPLQDVHQFFKARLQA